MPAYVTGHTLSNKRPTGELPNKTKYFIPHGLMVLPDHNNKYSHPTRELITPSAILTGKQLPNPTDSTERAIIKARLAGISF